MLVGSPNVAIVIAALNEEKGIGPTIGELREVLADSPLFVIDGNSTDRTVEIAKEFGAQIFMQKGFGKGNAVSEALTCIDCNPKYVVLTDADYTYPSKYVLDMVQILEDEPFVGMVTGNRFNGLLKAGSITNPFYIGNRILAIAQLALNGIRLNDPLTGLRVVRWSILRNWKPRSNGFDIEAELNHLVERRGYKIKELPIHYRKRLGEKKLKPKHGISILMRIVLESLQSDIRRHH